MFEFDRLAGVSCQTVTASSGHILLGVTPALHFEIERIEWRKDKNELDIRINRIDGQNTALSVHATKDSLVRAAGKWNLSGLDLTALLARVGLRWSSRTDVGLVEFESAGDASHESGRIQVSSWVLLGQNRARPFRLSVPGISAEFHTGDSEIIFPEVVIDRPSYDLLGANPDLLKALMSASSRRSVFPGKPRGVKVGVSDRHRARVESLPDTFSVQVLRLRIDTGAALALDRPDRTRFAMKVTDLAADITGRASVMDRAPNTHIRFMLNDKKEMRWTAITDFSTWPPQFRFTDVR